MKPGASLGSFRAAIAESIWLLFRNAFMHGYSCAFLFLLGLSLAAFLVVAAMMKNIARNELKASPRRDNEAPAASRRRPRMCLLCV